MSRATLEALKGNGRRKHHLKALCPRPGARKTPGTCPRPAVFPNLGLARVNATKSPFNLRFEPFRRDLRSPTQLELFREGLLRAVALQHHHAAVGPDQRHGEGLRWGGGRVRPARPRLLHAHSRGRGVAVPVRGRALARGVLEPHVQDQSLERLDLGEGD